MSHALGIDLGGTKILAGLIDIDNGQVLATAVRPTHDGQDAVNLLDRIVATAKEAMARADVPLAGVRAAGVGIAGQVDSENGVLVRAPNLPDVLTGIPLARRLGEELRMPVTMVNDVVAAAAGEAHFGAGRGVSDFVCIFVGTGIGGGVYRNGRPYWGSTNTAGELGHMVVAEGGRLCGCGGRGHLEAYASRTAILRTVLGELRLGRPSVLAEIEPNPDPDEPENSAIDHRALAAAVRSCDRLALDAVSEAARYMAAGLVSIINFYNPPRIVLGGGVVGELDPFFDLAIEGARTAALSVPSRRVEMVRAEMGENPGIIGAATLAYHDIQGG